MFVDGRIIATVVITASFFAPLDGLTSFLASYDTHVFCILLVLFVIVSIIGTRIVLRCGELPGNDELFNMPELTPAQRAG